MNMRPSRTLELLRAGKPAFSVKLNTSDPRIAEIAAMVGMPCLWVDMEHTANDYFVTEQQIMIAKAYNTDVLARVPRGSYSDYIRPLELDAAGLMVPHIARTLTGNDVRKLLPVSALLGGILVILADLLGRVLFAPSEIPAGIITSLIGAPFFFILLLQRRNRL